MKKNLVTAAMFGHLGGSFGPSFRVYRDAPDDDANDLAQFGGEAGSWGHSTTVEGNNLVGLGLDDQEDFDMNPDKKGDVEDEEDDEEEEAAPSKKEEEFEEDEEDKEEQEEEDEEEQEEEEEKEEDEEDEEEQDEEEKEEKADKSEKTDVRTASQKRVDSTFKQLRLAEKAYRTATAQGSEAIDPNKLSPELISKRDTLIRERASLDPIAREEDAGKMADIDIQLEDIRMRVMQAANRAESDRSQSTNKATSDADAAVKSTLDAIASTYEALDAESNKANEKAIRYFNISQKGYMDEGLSVADAIEKAMAEVVDVFSLKATGASSDKKLTTKERTKKEEELARNGVKQRLDSVAKKPLRGKRQAGGATATLAELVRGDFSDKKVQKGLEAQLGIKFEN